MNFAENIVIKFLGNLLEGIFSRTFSKKNLSVRFKRIHDFLEELQGKTLYFWKLKYFFSWIREHNPFVDKKLTEKEWISSRSNSRWKCKQMSQYYLINFQKICTKGLKPTIDIPWGMFNLILVYGGSNFRLNPLRSNP